MSDAEDRDDEDGQEPASGGPEGEEPEGKEPAGQDPQPEEDADADEEEDADEDSEDEADQESDEDAEDGVESKRESGALIGALSSVLGFVVALGIGFYFGQAVCNPKPEGSVAKEDNKRFSVALRGDEPQLGPDDALVTIIEFADYQCPHCGRASAPVEKAVENADGEVRLIYKHYPLPNHKQAFIGARAAFAAMQQGKFWEIHHYLFETKASVAELTAEVKRLGMDETKFAHDMESQAATDAVEGDRKAGGKIRVTATPTFIVNGHIYRGFKNESDWARIIDEQLPFAQSIVDDGTPRAGVYRKIMEGAVEQRLAAPPSRRAGEPDPAVTYRVTTDDRPSLGPADALVTVVEFSDFQCPYCARMGPTVHELVEKHSDVRVVFRQLPLPNHPQARDAAKASLAAHRQGKFWEMHDKLFANRELLRVANFEEWAAEIGCDVERFKTDVADPALEELIKQDEALAKQFGVQSTPTSFVNGRYVRGAQPTAGFDEVINAERQRAQQLVDDGVSPGGVYSKLMETAASSVSQAAGSP